MQVYSIVEKEAQMNRTAQRIREIVLSRLSVYIRVCADKNDVPCRTNAKKSLKVPMKRNFLLGYLKELSK